MYVEIQDREQTKFLDYLQKQHSDAYSVIPKFAISIDSNDKPKVVPWNCEFVIPYSGNDFSIVIKEEGVPLVDAAGKLRYYMRMTVSHECLDKIKEFVTAALTYKDPEETTLIEIFHSKARHEYWSRRPRVHAQDLNNVFIPAAMKSSIISHIDKFITSGERYRQFGRSHKLTFLLTGVPGSGKSSLIKALAKHLSRPLYVLCFSKHMDDDSLIELINEIKTGSILLLEDIDAFFVDRETKDINISFSTFINILDGASAPVNGTIIFMTANNPERLDSALVRPGRVDRIIKFDHPQKPEIMDAFFMLTGQSPSDETAKAQFTQFYKLVGNMRVSMAAIVDYLFRYSTDYMDHIDELAAHTKMLHDMANSKNDVMYK